MQPIRTSSFISRLALLLALPLALFVAGCDDNGGGDDNADPTAAFSFSPESPAVGETVTFSNESTDDGSIASYNWSFGNGATSTDENPTTTYDAEDTYEVTLEVTDSEGASASTTQEVTVGAAEVTEEVVSDDITEDATWSASTEYTLDGLIFVEEGAVLTIEAGTVIKARTQSAIESGDGASALIIQRGAQINAVGTPDSPIIFTSTEDDVTDPADLTQTDRGLWGGVIILGRAPTNEPSTDIAIEGVPEGEGAFYGGDDPADNSGTMQYVSIRHGGFSISGVAGDEINGLTMGAVGSGTTIDHVEVFANNDDGFEWFGGTVETSHLVAAFCLDDSYDYDQGFRGRGQYWFSIQNPDEAGRAGEHDGGDTEVEAAGFSLPLIANATYIGTGVDSAPAGDGNDPAIRLRENAGGKYYNSIFTSFPGEAIRIDAEDTQDRFDAGDIAFEGNVFFNFGAGSDFASIIRGDFADDYFAENNQLADPSLAISYMADGGLDPRPTADVATTGAVDFDEEDSFFEDVDYIGAFAPGEDLWTSGWTSLSQNGYAAE